jgi:hypothetical protein
MASNVTINFSGSLDKADAREILELRAKEVSLVDRPAILRQFLVVKRQQQEATMGAFDNTDGSQPVPIEKMLEQMNWVEGDVEKALPIDLRNAISAALKWFKKPEGEAPTDALDRVAAFLGKVAGGKYPYPSPQGKEAKKAASDKCPKCGEAMKDGTCAGCGYTAKADDEDAGKACGGAAGGKKTKKDMEGGLTISISPDGDLEISGEKVTKGLKGFTADRSKTLGDVVKSLLNLLAEVDSETTKSIIDELAKGILPANIKWTSGTQALPASVQKGLGDEVAGAIAAALAPVTKRLEEVSTQVEAITKARPEPKSEGGNTTDTVKKGMGFWEGVPLR